MAPDVPVFRLVYWRDKFKAMREELEKQGMPNKIKPRQLWETEINGLKFMEADLEERISSKGQAKYAAQATIRAKIRVEQKKQRWDKVIIVVSKVILVSIGIFYGLIIMENILAGKPISTYLNRVLTGE